ncbi:MAG: dihydrolipoamide succinyltransferase [Gammaproteobacteria bacterium]|nr:MAG: dihydrolipoamide succinyltransferase [Gammaproteobacteria bacterium]RLA48656.1 MAG: dihydrolipoamide succinyltransferase [Gammaproteobacteria bacterium]
MLIDIKVPVFPESVQEGAVATWHKQPGEAVARDDLLVDIETDKVMLEVVAPQNGSLTEILQPEGAILIGGEILGRFDTDAQGAALESATAPVVEATVSQSTPGADVAANVEVMASPAARKWAAEKGINLAQVQGTGKDGRITKEDVVKFVPPPVVPVPAAAAPAVSALAPASEAGSNIPFAGERIEKRVAMTRMRARIAERLLQVTQSTAMLTTFNEVDMHRIIDLRTQFRDQFQQVHNGTRLGFMGFFVRAVVEALKRFPLVNASIDGNEVIYHGYQDIGVAVSTDRGLVVPVLRDADQLSIAEIESGIAEYGTKARDGKLTIEDMTGGTFTITNGGVYGSLMSTPILNPPQTAILGMHSIKERPIAEDGEVLIRPMMNLALSYDHRLIDGREAVLFLVAVKDMIENPAKILLEI